MTDNHPITPPPELVGQWYQEADNQPAPYYVYMAHQAARWGADQELEACCEWLPSDLTINGESLRDVRRPKPPSLKEQALDTLNLMLMFLPPGGQREQGETIRRALEALPD